MRIHKLVIRL